MLQLGYVTLELANLAKYLAIAISFLMLVSFIVMRCAITRDIKQLVTEQIKTFTLTFGVCFSALIIITVLLYLITFSKWFSNNGRLANIRMITLIHTVNELIVVFAILLMHWRNHKKSITVSWQSNLDSENDHSPNLKDIGYVPLGGVAPLSPENGCSQKSVLISYY